MFIQVTESFMRCVCPYTNYDSKKFTDFVQVWCNRLRIDIHMSEELEMQMCILPLQLDRIKLYHLSANSINKIYMHWSCTQALNSHLINQ